MIIKVTVNLGNYENISVESSEYKSMQSCCAELYTVLRAINEPRVDDFCKKVFKEEYLNETELAGEGYYGAL